jgi:hypothetical protein
MYRNSAKILADAEIAIVRENWLRKGLGLTDEDLDKANKLVDIALASGYPSQFLSAFAEVIRKPTFLSRSCWWCKLKRKLNKMFERKWV